MAHIRLYNIINFYVINMIDRKKKIVYFTITCGMSDIGTFDLI